MTQRKIKVIADSHLGTKPGDEERMIRFIDSVDPSVYSILFLGDLFHIWAGPKRYHTPSVSRVLERISEFRRAGGSTYLVAGNRDVFFREEKNFREKNRLPFDRIELNFMELEFNGRKLLAFHGDTVNRLDRQYLCWRKLIRSAWFRFIFGLLPSPLVKKIMFSLEEKLKRTNPSFRKAFPEEEWLAFLESVAAEFDPAMVLAGHFHPEAPIVSQVRSLTGIVVPGWCESAKYLEITEDLSYKCMQFGQ